MLEPPIHTSVDHVHAHPRHVGHRWIDLILALTAVFISGVSLYVAVEHGRIEQQLVHANAQLVQANSWPFLQIDGQYSRQSTTRISLVNAGIGPAKLETFEVLYQGQPIGDFYTLMQRCCGLATTPDGRRVQFPAGLSLAYRAKQVIRPGESQLVMEVPASPDQHDVSERFLKESKSITYRACYCSVFNQCWISNLAGLQPAPAATCPTGTSSFNEGTQ